MNNIPEQLQKLYDFYREVDIRIEQLKFIHSQGLKCKAGCDSCCIDEITVFAVEGENIKSRVPDLLQNEHPMPVGRCAFLNQEKFCRIYDIRPYVCRTQGLPFRWIESSGSGNTELRDICPVNDPFIPVMNLDVGECFTIGPFEQRLLELQMAFDPVHPKKRVPLRSLFVKI